MFSCYQWGYGIIYKSFMNIKVLVLGNTHEVSQADEGIIWMHLIPIQMAICIDVKQ